MSTSEMEDLQNAVSCVHTFAEELGKLYAPFVSQTAQALLPVFDFNMDEGVRDMAFEVWGLLCQAAREGGQPEVVSQLVQEFMKRLLPKLESIANTTEQIAVDTEALRTVADGIKVLLQKAGPNVLSGEQVAHIHQVALQCLNHSLKKRDAEEQTQRRQPQDEDDNPVNDEEEEDERNFRVALVEMVGPLMEQSPDAYASTCLPLAMQLVGQFIQPAVRWEDRRLALFVVLSPRSRRTLSP